MFTDYSTHPSDLLAHEAHHKIGQALGEYYTADEKLITRPHNYMIHHDTGNAILHEAQCLLFELKSRSPLSGVGRTRQPLPQRASGAIWIAITLGFVLGLLVSRLRYD